MGPGRHLPKANDIRQTRNNTLASTPRRRGRPRKLPAELSENQEVSMELKRHLDGAGPQEPKRGRGRPRLSVQASSLSFPPKMSLSVEQRQSNPIPGDGAVKRGRGRPKLSAKGPNFTQEASGPNTSARTENSYFLRRPNISNAATDTTNGTGKPAKTEATPATANAKSKHAEAKSKPDTANAKSKHTEAKPKPAPAITEPGAKLQGRPELSIDKDKLTMTEGKPATSAAKPVLALKVKPNPTRDKSKQLTTKVKQATVEVKEVKEAIAGAENNAIRPQNSQVVVVESAAPQGMIQNNGQNMEVDESGTVDVYQVPKIVNAFSLNPIVPDVQGLRSRYEYYQGLAQSKGASNVLATAQTQPEDKLIENQFTSSVPATCSQIPKPSTPTQNVSYGTTKVVSTQTDASQNSETDSAKTVSCKTPKPTSNTTICSRSQTPATAENGPLAVLRFRTRIKSAPEFRRYQIPKPNILHAWDSLDSVHVHVSESLPGSQRSRMRRLQAISSPDPDPEITNAIEVYNESQIQQGDQGRPDRAQSLNVMLNQWENNLSVVCIFDSFSRSRRRDL